MVIPAGLAYYLAGGVNWRLLACLLLGSLAGAQLGSRVTMVVPERAQAGDRNPDHGGGGGDDHQGVVSEQCVLAFALGLGGTLKFAWSGFVDVRLAMIILAGSLFGVQLGAIGTTYVRPFMIKVVMGVVMLTVLVSRGLVIPVHLSQLGVMGSLDDATEGILKKASFAIMVLALALGAFIVLRALVTGCRSHKVPHRVLEEAGVSD